MSDLDPELYITWSSHAAKRSAWNGWLDFMKHTKSNCKGGHIIITFAGLQCGNCGAMEKKNESHNSTDIEYKDGKG